jgi:uncharacterized protein (DUF952 family)
VSLIYKLLERNQWEAARAFGRFDGSEVDLADGYIHFSAADQVQETARRHFHGVGDLLLLAVEVEALGPALRWEPSRGGALFPHLYGPLPVDAVRQVQAAPLDAEAIPITRVATP